MELKSEQVWRPDDRVPQSTKREVRTSATVLLPVPHPIKRAGQNSVNFSTAKHREFWYPRLAARISAYTIIMLQHLSHRARTAILALVAYWTLLFSATHLPNLGVHGVNRLDKVVHAGGYFVLALLLAAVIFRRQTKPLGAYLMLLTVVMAYAALDEISQIPVGRSADLYDWLADLVGAAAGFVTFARAQRWLVQRIPPEEPAAGRSI